MTQATTLRTLSGLPASPPPLSRSALILVDCQNTYREGTMQLEGVEAALEQCHQLLLRARRLGIPVFHIQHDAGPGTPYDIRTPLGEIASPVRPLEGEPVLVKNFPNAFLQTTLDLDLKAAGARDLVIVGFMTHMCISSTARAAFDLGYANTVVATATATRALPGADGALLPAAAVQAGNLAAIGDLFSLVVPAGDAIPD